MRSIRIPMLVAALWACGLADGSSADAGADGGTLVGCDGDERVPSWSAGLSVRSNDGAIMASIEAATPELPARGANTWKVKFTDASGAPIDGAALSVEPFMPDHGHGSSVAPVVGVQSGGLYEVSKLTFMMPGVWRVTFRLTPAGGTAHDAVFFVCVAG